MATSEMMDRIVAAQNAAQNKADAALRDATAFMTALAGAASFAPPDNPPELGTGVITGDLLWSALPQLVYTAPTAPAVNLSRFDAVAKPAAPALGGVTLPSVPNIPDLAIVEPVLSMPTAPSTSLPAAPGNAPEFVSPALPTKPTFTLPAAPTFESIALPEIPSFDMPALDASLPYDELVLTTSEFEFAEREYQSALMDAAKAKLMGDLVNGGYGIDTDDEDRLWQRMRERELRELDAAVADLARQTAARGFSLPTGAMIARMDAARQAATEKISSASREVATKRADMYVENRKFTLTQVTQIEQILMGYASAVQERALNMSRAQVELGVTLYNARVSRYNAQLEAFKAAAQVYESRIRGAMLAIESYKTKVEAVRVGAEAQRTHAEVYRTQLQGVEALIGAYTSEVQAARTLADIERVKLEGFKSTVDAYTAQVGARAAEFQMYEAQLRGEQTKVNLYMAQVQAYAQKVDAIKSRTGAETAVASAQIAANEALLSKYRTELAGFKEEIDRVNAQVSATLAAYGADIQRYSATAGATGKYYDLAIAAQEANNRTNVELARVAVANAQVRIQSVLEAQKIRVAAIEGGAQVAGNIGAAAMSSLNSIVAATAQTTE